MMKIKKKRSKFVSLSIVAFIALIVISWIYLIQTNEDIFDVFDSRNMEFLRSFVEKLLGKDTSQVAFLSPDRWWEVIKLSYETIAMSVLATGLATIGTLITVFPAASNVANGKLLMRKNWYGKILFFLIRIIYIINRSVPELVWGMIIVFFLKGGILPGALALFIHNFGVLGRMCAEVVEDIDVKPIRALSMSGASGKQALLYGIIPMCIEKFLYYMLFRFEVIVRSTIVVGAVGAGGLGLYFKLKMSSFDYTGVTLVILMYLIVVYLTDLVSFGLKKLYKN